MGKHKEREANIAREVEHIYESWVWHLKDKLDGADRIIRLMMNDMALVGASHEKAVAFLQPKFLELIREISEEQTIKKGRKKSE
jgi:hypothetical protein